MQNSLLNAWCEINMPIEHENLLEYLADREWRIRNNAVNSKWLGRSFAVWVVMLMLILLLAVRRVAYDDSAYVLFVFFIISLVFIAFNSYWRKRNCTDDEMEAIISAADNDLVQIVKTGKYDIFTSHLEAARGFESYMVSLAAACLLIETKLAAEFEGDVSLKPSHDLLNAELRSLAEAGSKFGICNRFDSYFALARNSMRKTS